MIQFTFSLILTMAFVFEAGATALRCEELFKKEDSQEEIWDLLLPQAPTPALHSTQIPSKYLRAALSDFPEPTRLDTNHILEYFNRKSNTTSDREVQLLQGQLQSRAQALQAAEAWSVTNGWNPTQSKSLEILSDDFVRIASDSWLVQKDHSVSPNLIAGNPFFSYRQGWFNIVVHGSGSTFLVNQQIVSADILAQEIKKRNHTNEPINLLSCRAGTCTLAQDLADALGVPVVGSSQTIETTYSRFQLILGVEPNYHELHGQWEVYLPRDD